MNAKKELILTLKKPVTDFDISLAQMIADGKTSKEIGIKLKKSSRTVEADIAKAKKRYGCSSSIELIMLFKRNNLIE